MQTKDTFELRERHLKLARAMYVGWQDCETGAPEIDPKLPYGNSGVAEDVAEIIGEPWPNEDLLSADEFDRQLDDIIPRMLDIHREMVTALEIILGAAGSPVLPGSYRNVAERYGRNRWERVS